MSSKDTSKVDPFIRKCLGVQYRQLPFENLTVSTATIDVRLVENAEINYELLFQLLQIEPISSKDKKKAPGTIFAGRCGRDIRGTPPTDSTASLKNCMMIWMWLEDKYVNMKISRNNVHITGCKTADHAAEAVRYLQMHIDLIHSDELPMYENYPYIVDFDIHMINYNFSTSVAIDLATFDIFVNTNYQHMAYSPFDVNVCSSHMTLHCPKYSITFTLNDNGQISMCTKGETFEMASQNVCEGYALFYDMLTRYKATL